jgi:hypothetical protein
MKIQSNTRRGEKQMNHSEQYEADGEKTTLSEAPRETSSRQAKPLPERLLGVHQANPKMPAPNEDVSECTEQD